MTKEMPQFKSASIREDELEVNVEIVFYSADRHGVRENYVYDKYTNRYYQLVDGALSAEDGALVKRRIGKAAFEQVMRIAEELRCQHATQEEPKHIEAVQSEQILNVFPQVGQVLPNGHTVDAAYCVGNDRYVLAHKDGAPEPYAVWCVDQDGDTRNGRYFADSFRAQRHFANCCYDWSEKLEQVDHEQKLESPKRLESALKCFSACMHKANQVERNVSREQAILTPELQTALQNIHNVSELERLIHFWWIANKHQVCDTLMEQVLWAMHRHFLLDRQII